jgi:ubiquinone/menaquinone biosynthesis C-methylase UbiE
MDKKNIWASGDSYEPYVGRWSRLVAKEFLTWINAPTENRWLDVGCGTGALSQTILSLCDPGKIKGIDRSDGFVEYVRRKVTDPRATFETGDAQALPVKDAEYDVAVSGLVLNFVPQPEKMISEMKRTVLDGGIVALYVWDYADKMQLMRHFWNAATELDPAVLELDESKRFSICNPDSLRELFQRSGMKQVETRAIDVDTHFRDFDDYWNPFLGGQGPAAGYAMSLNDEKRTQLRERIRAGLPFALDGSIPLVARAWGIKGVK